MIATEQICEWVEKIGERFPRPVWIPEKRVFEFPELNPDTVAYLKIVRATQSLHALPLLFHHGLTADFGTIVRSIIECLDDALFLLERNPDTAKNVERFVEAFQTTVIDNSKASVHQPVSRSKIQNAATRTFSSILNGVGIFGEQEKLMKQLREQIWNAFCNSVHSNYAEIMLTFGPLGPDAKFQLRGLSLNGDWAGSYFKWIEAMNLEAAFSLHFMAIQLGLPDLAHRIYVEIAKN